MEISSTLPRHGGIYPFQKEFSSKQTSSSSSNSNRDFMGSVTPTLTPKNLHRGVGGIEGNNHHFSSCLYGVPPPSANMIKRTRNDEEFFGGFRRSSSLRRSHRENICPHHGNNPGANTNSNVSGKPISTHTYASQGVGYNKSAIPGKAERTSSSSAAGQNAATGMGGSGGRPSYLQGTVSSVRRSRERPDETNMSNHGRNSSVRRSNSTISRNASFRSRKSSASLAATNRQQHSPTCQHHAGSANPPPTSQLRYENELKGHSNNNNYYHLSHGHHSSSGDQHRVKDNHGHHRLHRNHHLAGSNNNLVKAQNLNSPSAQRISLNGNHVGCNVHKNSTSASVIAPNKSLHHQNVTGSRHQDLKAESSRFPRTSSFSFRNGIFGRSGGGGGIGEKPAKSLSFSTDQLNHFSSMPCLNNSLSSHDDDESFEELDEADRRTSSSTKNGGKERSRKSHKFEDNEASNNENVNHNHHPHKKMHHHPLRNHHRAFNGSTQTLLTTSSSGNNVLFSNFNESENLNYPNNKTLSHHRSNHMSTTPSSSNLVLNSLAYQILPSSPSTSTLTSATSAGTLIPAPSSALSNGHVKLTHFDSNPSSKTRFEVGSVPKSLSATSSGSSASSGNNNNNNNRSNKNNAKKSSSSSSNGAPQSMSVSSSLQSNPSIPTSPVVLRKRPVADDIDGHLAYLVGDVVGERYEVVSNLGEGTFGKVAKVKDLHKNNAYVALKIIKNIHKYREAAKLEINVLRKLNAKDAEGKNLCVRMYDAFNYYGHMCITFEVLGESVFDFLKSNTYVPYPMEQVRHISQQLCQAVAFMHEQRVTHTDLKPENVLFMTNDWYTENVPGAKKPVRRMRDTRVKLIDFGSATFEWEHHSSVVSTRHYRAPEVILELGWSHPCDVWSVGCIIFELYQGHTLFQTHDNREHLAMMEKILDRVMPQHMVRRTKTKYFNSQAALNWDPSAPEAKYTNQHCKPLHQYQRYPSSSHQGKEEVTMYDLIIRMLDYDPTFRITLKESLRHHFFDKMMAASSKQPGMSHLSRHILRLQI